ncbi:hypothetical protein ABZT02_35015 [Streptomyces sp. NPDC005402]|uniref:hypothetical protein n=1 Tax=Streptomyces sp. NPDC005402 TaxID=3155338 RepID=UPI0033B8BC19
MVFDPKQVRDCLTDPSLRAQALARVTDQIHTDTRVVVAHSLDSVVAYEALCARPGHQVRALVTIGSPLGIPNVNLHRLHAHAASVKARASLRLPVLLHRRAPFRSRVAPPRHGPATDRA